MRALKYRACLALGLMACAVIRDRSLAAEGPAAKPDDPVVAAIVNGDPIYVAEIESLLAQARGARQASAQATPVTRAETLRQIVNQRVAEEALKRDEAYVKKSEIDTAMKKIEAQAKGQRLGLEQFIAARGITVNTVRHELTWQIGWPKYVEGNLADALEGYFKEHHKDYDGTLVRVSHILLRPEKPADGNGEIIERAEKIRAEIEAGKITFEQAAEKYSAGPSRHKEGDLGFFPRSGVMVEEFSKAAFALAKGEISQPVQTAFGVHLIRATDIRAGTRQWTEAAGKMKVAASQDLFEQLAKKERANAKIEFTGRVPYYDPETGELVTPAKQK